MRKVQIATFVVVFAAGACSAASGGPVQTAAAAPAGTAAVQPPPPATAAPTQPRAKPSPTPLGEPIPEAYIGAWYHAAPAFWWLLRAGSPTCIKIAHTDVDCVAYQLGAQPAYVGAATMDGRILRIRWTRGYCAGDRTNFGTGIDGNTLKLFDLPDDCGGADFVLSRAGTGAAPSAPPPPEE